jgi:hypothetical protein
VARTLLRAIALSSLLCSAAVLAWLLMSSRAQAAPGDSCASRITVELGARLETAYPEFRVPRESDNLPDDVAYSRANGGSGCLGADTADFDGDGRIDVVVALTPRENAQGSRIVAALAQSQGWVLAELGEYGPRSIDRRRIFVGTLAPGRYRRSEALEGVDRPPMYPSLYCPRKVAAFGTTESTQTVGCLFRGRWFFVQTHD